MNRFRYPRSLQACVCVIALVIFSCERKEKGLKIERYSNDNIKSLKRYNKEVLHGESVWFYPNGNTQEKVMFRNGKANGHAYYFYKSGALESHRFWINDKMVGFCADYYDDTVGIIKASLLFNDSGELVYKKSFDVTGRVTKVEGTR